MEVSSPTAEQLQTKAAKCTAHGDFDSKAIQLPTFGNRLGKVIWSSCPECSRLSAEQDVSEKRANSEQERQLRIESRLSRAGIPRRFRNRSFESYVADTDSQRSALSTAREFADNFVEHSKRGSTLVFSGNIGTGKGHLAIAAAQQVINQGYSVFFVTAREIILMLRARWDDSSATSELEVVRMLTSVSLLVIDEIGVQFNTDAERDQLFCVIDGRYRDMMPTILTTNLNKKSLKDIIGERSFSRLREEGTWVAFDWDDFRGCVRISAE